MRRHRENDVHSAGGSVLRSSPVALLFKRQRQNIHAVNGKGDHPSAIPVQMPSLVPVAPTAGAIKGKQPSCGEHRESA